MHELSICEYIVETLQEQARLQDYSRVGRVQLEIGTLAAVEIEALRFGFEVVSRNTLAEGAVLDIVSVQARARCQKCGQIFALQQRFDPCPHCGSHSLQLRCGEEMRIKQLEVD